MLGLLLTTQAALEQFDPKGGSIINIGSVAADGVPTAAVYSATKGAVDTISASLAQELGPRKIRVNSLNPGMIETEGVHAAGFIGSDFHQKAAEARHRLAASASRRTSPLSRRFLPLTMPSGSTARPSTLQAAFGSKTETSSPRNRARDPGSGWAARRMNHIKGFKS